MTVSDIIVSPVYVFYSDPDEVLPDDDLAVGGAWPVGWTALGYTKEPLTLSRETDSVNHEIQQSIMPVGKTLTSEEIVVETVMAELTGENLELLFGGTLTPTAAGVGQVGKEELEAGDDPRLTIQQWGFEGDYIDEDGANFPIRFFIYLGHAKLGGELEFGKSDTVGVPLRVEALSDLTKDRGKRAFFFQKVLEPATS